MDPKPFYKQPVDVPVLKNVTQLPPKITAPWLSKARSMNLGKILDNNIYRGNLRDEIATADQYNKDNNIPIRMQKWYDPLLVADGRDVPQQIGTGVSASSNYRPAETQAAFNMLRGDKIPPGKKHNKYSELQSLIKSRPGRLPEKPLISMNPSLRPDLNRELSPRIRVINGFPGTGKLNQATPLEVLRHEGAHYVEDNPSYGPTVAEAEAIERSKPTGVIPPKIPDFLVPRPESKIDEVNRSLSPPITYPEMMGREKYPQYHALQSHLYNTTGKRLESPEEYRDYMREHGTVGLSMADAEKKIAELPVELQRMHRNRRTIDLRNKWDKRNDPVGHAFGDYGSEGKYGRNKYDKTLPFQYHDTPLDFFDNEAAKKVPGWVHNAPQRDSRRFLERNLLPGRQTMVA